MPLDILTLRLKVVLLALFKDGLFHVINRWRNFPHPFLGVPNLQDDVEYGPVDLPGRAAEDVESSVNEFDFSFVRGFAEIDLLFVVFFEPHCRS
jgi:hypothetical protein